MGRLRISKILNEFTVLHFLSKTLIVEARCTKCPRKLSNYKLTLTYSVNSLLVEFNSDSLTSDLQAKLTFSQKSERVNMFFTLKEANDMLIENDNSAFKIVYPFKEASSDKANRGSDTPMLVTFITMYSNLNKKLTFKPWSMINQNIHRFISTKTFKAKCSCREQV